jgi:hypothetical protein
LNNFSWGISKSLFNKLKDDIGYDELIIKNVGISRIVMDGIMIIKGFMLNSSFDVKLVM